WDAATTTAAAATDAAATDGTTGAATTRAVTRTATRVGGADAPVRCTAARIPDRRCTAADRSATPVAGAGGCNGNLRSPRSGCMMPGELSLPGRDALPSDWMRNA